MNTAMICSCNLFQTDVLSRVRGDNLSELSLCSNYDFQNLMPMRAEKRKERPILANSQQ